MDNKKILTMIDEGKITAVEGAQLLAAMQEKPQIEKSEPKKLHFEIKDFDDNSLVNFSIPLKLLKFGLNFMPKGMNLKVNHGNEFDFSSINWDELMEIAASGETGDVLNLEVDSTKKGKVKIHIYIQ